MVWLNGELKLNLEACLREMARVFFGDHVAQLDLSRCGAQVVRHLYHCGPLVIFDYFEGHCDKSLAIRRELGDPIGQCETLLKLAELRMTQGKKTEALELARLALAILKTTEDSHRIEQGQELLRQWELTPA